MIQQYLKENILITDGAMGTYFSQISGKDSTSSELANKDQGDIITSIHKEYINSGAKLIRTNSFALNTRTMNLPRAEIKELIIHSYANAVKAVDGREIFIGISIGPIPGTDIETSIDERLDEYKFIVDTFINEGAEIFIFETFSDTLCLQEIAKYIKERNSNAFVLTQFAVMTNGRTRNDIALESLVEVSKNCSYIDAFGFNCGVGPSHLLSLIKNIDPGEKFMSVLPNAGYPQIVNERTIFAPNAQYFGDLMAGVNQRVKIVGGCCGTTPVHIKALTDRLRAKTVVKGHPFAPHPKISVTIEKQQQHVGNELAKVTLPIAVDLTPPQDSNATKFLASAKRLRDYCVDFITIPDSPLGRVRADSITMAAKVSYDTGMNVIPHICCRDKNILALKSSILAGHIAGLRNILAITGDPVPQEARSEATSVFNMNSIRLLKLIHEMNSTFFEESPYNVYCALNPNVSNKEAELRRMLQKAETGPVTFITQPIFDNEGLDFIKEAKSRTNSNIFVGIIPIVSYKNAMFLNNEMPGINIPQKYINSFYPEMDRESAEGIGIEVALGIAKLALSHCDGYYLTTPFNRVDMVGKIADGIRNLGAGEIKNGIQ